MAIQDNSARVAQSLDVIFVCLERPFYAQSARIVLAPFAFLFYVLHYVQSASHSLRLSGRGEA